MIPAPSFPRIVALPSSAFLTRCERAPATASDTLGTAAAFDSARLTFEAALLAHRSEPWGLTMANDLAIAERFDAAAAALLATPAPDAIAIRYKANVAHHSGYRSTPEEQVSLMTDALRVYGMEDGR